MVVPDDVIKKVLKDYPSCCGVAVRDAADAKFITLKRTDKEMTLNKVQAGMTALKDRTMLMYFGNHTNDVQPFTFLVGDGDKPLLVGCLSGDFANFEKAGEHSSEFTAFDEYLKTKVLREHKRSKNFEEFLDALKDPILYKEMLNTFLGEGAITMMAYTGEIFTYAHEPEKTKQSWGWSSMEFEEKVEPPPPPEKKEDEDDPFDISHTTEKEKEEEKKEAEPPFEPDPKKEEVKADDSTIMLAPPVTLTQNGTKREWYNKMYGKLPKNWKQRPAVPVSKKKLIDMAQTGAMEAIIKYFDFKDIPTDLLEAMKKAAPVEVKKKDTTVHEKEIETSALPVETKASVAEVSPVISAESRDQFREYYKGRGFNSHPLTINPEFIQSMETKLPSFAKVMGMDGFQDTFKMAFKDRLELCKKWPDAAAKLLQDLTVAYMKTLIKAEAAPAKQTPPVETTPEDEDDPFDLSSNRKVA
jgi:hypothetical protein